ncbi:MAG: adenylate/guanylate cyclase domain-containing protein [Candidatus Accumulibacter sp.]|nr:adenylate/guanylate cyclase domain-containing protein [Accumulibacter sp.]
MLLVLLTPVWDIEEGSGLTLLYLLRGVRPSPPQVVIIALDAASAAKLGQSERPERWSRALHAQLVDGLAARSAAVIGFDILFERPRDASDDRKLAQAFRRAGNVILAEQIVRESVRATDGLTLATIERRIRAMPSLLEAAVGSGPFVMPKAPGGVFEFWQHLPSAGDSPSLPLLMARFLNIPGADRADDAVNSRKILSLYGPIGTIRTYSYAQALELIADPIAGHQAFADKAVLIGFSETNQSRQMDAYRTPYTTEDGVDLSGVELCATALANLLDNQHVSRPAEGTLLPLLVLWSLVLALPWKQCSTRRALMITIILGVLALAISGWAFARFAIWLPVMLICLIAPGLTSVIGISSHMVIARNRERQLSQAVALGLTPKGSEALAKLLAGCEAGRIVHSVCLCSDIIGYTALVERLAPEEARNLLNRYFSRFIPLVEAHGGQVMDIVGDAVLSIWLADDGAAAACQRSRTAVLSLDRSMNDHEGDGALPTRFGLHYGPVFLGELGHTHHREIRVVGNIVNTASRIQSANKSLGTRILASAEMVAIDGPGYTRALGRFLLAGKSHAVNLHEISPEPIPEELASRFSEGLAWYTAGDNALALNCFTNVLARFPEDGPTRFYAQQCRLGEEYARSNADGSVNLSVK